jgi:hypothetical protein
MEAFQNPTTASVFEMQRRTSPFAAHCSTTIDEKQNPAPIDQRPFPVYVALADAEFKNVQLHTFLNCVRCETDLIVARRRPRRLTARGSPGHSKERKNRRGNGAFRSPAVYVETASVAV